jgi:hypothetical protein
VEVFNIQVDKPSAAVQAPVLHAWGSITSGFPNVLDLHAPNNNTSF